MSKSNFGLVRNLPLWRFYYKGTHSKPIRTTIAVVSNKPKVVTGYVLRRGNVVFATLQEAKIHSFKKSEIAKYNQTSKPSKSTLTKHSIMDIIVSGA